MRRRKHDVLFLHRYFYPEYVTSASLAYDVAETLSRHGVDVSVLCGYPKEYAQIKNVPMRENHNGIKIQRIRYIQTSRKSFLGRLINYFSFTFAVFLRLFKLKHYKLMIVYSDPPVLPIVPAISSALFKNRFIFVCYDVYPEIAYTTGVLSPKSFIGKVAEWVNRIVFRRVDKVVVLSNEMKEYLLRSRPFLRPEQVEIIPNWFEPKCVDNNYDKSIRDKIRRVKDDKTFIVGYFGNMGIAQDMDTLIQAIRRVKERSDIKFLFAGHGNKMPELKSLVEAENLSNVVIVDFLHGSDFEEALRISDCFVVSLAAGVVGLAVPSKTYSYMWAGKPIIAIMSHPSDTTIELKERNAGYWVMNGDVDELLRIIQELYSNPQKAKEMGENARRLYLEKYTKEKCTAQYVRLVKEIIGRD